MMRTMALSALAGTVVVGGGLTWQAVTAPGPTLEDAAVLDPPAFCAAPETAYEVDYCAGLADGSLLDPMPADYVHVRTLCLPPECDLSNALIIARDWGVGVYDADFETYVSPAAAERLTARLASQVP